MTCPPFWTSSFRQAATTPHEQTWHDGNGHSHLQATLLGPSLPVAISEDKLVLGTWQQIFHLECDVRGRERTIVVTVIGDQGQFIRN
jgi:secondary thiamine-phosphate synthase enzyme